MARNFLSGLFGKKNPEASSETDADTEQGETEEKDAAKIAPADTTPTAAPPIGSPPEEAQTLFDKFAEEKASIPPDSVPASELPTSVVNEEISAPPTSPQPPVASHEEAQTEPQKKKGFFSRLKDGLSKTSTRLSDGVASIFTKRKLDDEMLEELESLLISADLGVAAATQFTSELAKTRFDKEVTDEEVRHALADQVATTLIPLEKPLSINSGLTPHVILMTGVNGAGKTTTIGKLAAKFKAEGRSVMLAAGDTFRAAAIEQLTVWGERTDTPVIAHDVGSDAAGLAFDALKEAQAQNIDVLMIDTAGRLQNKKELMEELAKVVRVIQKVDEAAPHDTLLVLDATVGQNALSQVEAFQETAGITGLIMTKLDGTARGGVLVALANKYSVPIHYIGVGELVDDLQPFAARDFANALADVTQ